MSNFEFLDRSLTLQAEANLLRERRAITSSKDGMIEVNGKHYLNFASNDYLGLSQHESVLQAYVEGLAVYGSSSSASPILTGYSLEHKALEDDICEALNKPAALLFSSGFSANQAICEALFNNFQSIDVKQTKKQTSSAKRDSHIICDKLMHASFLKGAMQSTAKLKRFKHNDMQHASLLINKAPSNSLVATEGMFSMGGDVGLVEELQSILLGLPKDINKPWLMIDDAHAFGIKGENGFGTLDNAAIDETKVDIVMGTFGKALGTGGAFVAASTSFIEYLVNKSQHYIYSTSISAAQARATRVSLGLVKQGQEREQLQQNIDYFLMKAKQKALPLFDSNSQIQAVFIGEPALAQTLSRRLSDLGIWVPAIRTPTVPKNTDRLRITISALHKRTDLDALIDALSLSLEPYIEIIHSKLAAIN